MSELFDTTNSPISLDLPDTLADGTLPDLYVGLEAPLLAPGDGIITDRHHASADRYEADDPQNQIAGQISSFSLSGWLRHGCERVLIEEGVTVCHPGEADADYRRAAVYERDLDVGYHPKGSCTDDDAGPCLIYLLYGGFNDAPGRFIRHPLGFSPIRSHVDVTKGEAEGHYRQLSTHVRSRNTEDGGQPLRHATRDAVANVVGTWRLTLRECHPAYVGLLCEAVSYLDTRSDEYELQLGGKRNHGAGIVDAHVVNPLYTDAELRRVYRRNQQPTTSMERKDDQWRTECRPEFTKALQAHLAARGGDVPMPGGDGA